MNKNLRTPSLCLSFFIGWHPSNPLIHFPLHSTPVICPHSSYLLELQVQLQLKLSKNSQTKMWSQLLNIKHLEDSTSTANCWRLWSWRAKNCKTKTFENLQIWKRRAGIAYQTPAFEGKTALSQKNTQAGWQTTTKHPRMSSSVIRLQKHKYLNMHLQRNLPVKSGWAAGGVWMWCRLPFAIYWVHMTSYKITTRTECEEMYPLHVYCSGSQTGMKLMLRWPALL